MKKGLKYIILIGVAGLLAYNSVYFKKLDAQKTQVSATLNPTDYAQKFWTSELPRFMDSAVEVNQLVNLLKNDPKTALNQFAHTQGIGNTSVFLVKGEGIVESIVEDEVLVLVKSGTDKVSVKLITGMYFGNAVRDATGIIKMDDFSNTKDFNIVSSELNKLVSKQVLQPFKSKAVKGMTVQFVACTEMNKEQINTDNIQLLPVRINLVK